MRTIRLGLLVFLAWSSSIAQVVPTTTWIDFYSDASTVNGVPLPVGTLIQAYDPQGILCGEFQVHTEGSYGYLHVYGDDGTTEGIDEGASDGDTLTFFIQGVEAIGRGIWTSAKLRDTTKLDLHANLPAPAAPDLLSPPDNAIGIARPVEHRWSRAASPYPSIGVTTSHVQVATDNSMTQLVLDSSSITVDTLLVEGLQGGGEYFWRVRIENSVTGTGAWSVVRSFSTTVTAEVNLSHTLVEFGERAVGDTGTFRVFLRNPSGETVVVSEIRTTQSHFSVSPASGTVLGGDSLAIDVFYHPTGIGVHFDSLVVLSNAVTFLVYAELHGSSPAPGLVVEPSMIDFGTAAGGSAEIRFISTSVNAVRIDTIFVGTHYYGLELPGFPVFVEKAETLRVQLYFSPDTLRDFPDTLYVVDNVGTGGGDTRGVVVLTGRGTRITGVSASQHIPATYGLSQNFPNPFNPTTRILFDLPLQSQVELKVYTILGQEVATLTNEVFEAGEYTVVFEARSLPSGLYLYTLETVAVDPGGGTFFGTKRMILLK